MKIIFLDVDGVLNSNETKERTPTGFLGISPYLVKNLKSIVDKTDAKIVLTSTWKKCIDEDLEYLYENLGDKYKPIDFTKEPDGMLSLRGMGIKDYLSKHKVEEYVIIDDFEFDFMKQGLLEHFIWTDVSKGLTEKDSQKAIDILNGKLNSEEEVGFIKKTIFTWGYHR